MSGLLWLGAQKYRKTMKPNNIIENLVFNIMELTREWKCTQLYTLIYALFYNIVQNHIKQRHLN